MSPTGSSKTGIWVGRALSTLIVTGAIVLGLVILYHTNRYPRTDDAEVSRTLLESRRRWKARWSISMSMTTSS